jgi:hypothetical protein
MKTCRKIRVDFSDIQKKKGFDADETEYGHFKLIQGERGSLLVLAISDDLKSSLLQGDQISFSFQMHSARERAAADLEAEDGGAQ